MKLDLLRFEGTKYYKVEKIKKIKHKADSRIIQEEFLLKMDKKRYSENKTVIDFEVVKYYDYENYVVLQKFLNLVRNRKVVYNEKGEYEGCLNEDKIVKEWENFSNNILEQLEKPTKQSLDDLLSKRKFLIGNRYVNEIDDIFRIFFPKIFGQDINTSVIYKEKIDNFVKDIEIPLFLSYSKEKEAGNIMKIVSVPKLDNVYFRRYDILRALGCDIELEMEEKFTYYYDNTILLDKRDYTIERSLLKIGGEINSEYSNFTKIYVERVR